MDTTGTTAVCLQFEGVQILEAFRLFLQVLKCVLVQLSVTKLYTRALVAYVGDKY